MQLVLVSSIFPPDIGGPATHVADLRDELESRGHNITVLSLHDGRRTLRNPGLVRFPRWWPPPLRHLAFAKWLFKFRGEYECIYAAGLHPSAVLAGRLAGRPVVARVAGDPVWERARRLHRTTTTFEEYQDQDLAELPLRDRLVARVRDLALRHASVVVAPNQYLAEIVSKWLQHTREVQVVPNGVRIPTSIGPRKLEPGQNMRAIWIGRIIRTKNLDRVIEAIGRTPDVTLDVIGEGPERKSLEGRTTALGITERVRFAGALPHSDVLKNLADAHVLMNASDYEGLPHTFLEALSCGVPIIGPALGGVDELVGSGNEAIIRTTPTADGIANALAMLRDDPERLTHLSEAALVVSEQWQFSRTASAVERVIEGVAAKPTAVFTGKGALAGPPEELEAKFRILAEHFDSVLLNIGKPADVPPRCQVIAIPRAHPRLLQNFLFYGLGTLLALAKAVRRRPSVVFAQDPFSALGPMLLTPLLPRRMRPTILVGAHGDWRASSRLYGGPGRRLMAPVFDRLARWTVRRASVVRVVSESLERLVRDAGYRGPIVRYTGYSSFASFLDRPVPAPPSPRACFVGVLEDPKGLDVLLHAWTQVERRVPGASLVIAGDGQLEGALRELSESEGHTGVRFTGRLSRKEVKALIDDSTCLVLPSRSEGLPRIIQEASARARPVIATQVGGIPEIVTAELTGLLVAPDDEDQLANALVRVLTEPAEAAAMGRAARERVESRDLLGEYAQGIAQIASIATMGHTRREPTVP